MNSLPTIDKSSILWLNRIIKVLLSSLISIIIALSITNCNKNSTESDKFNYPDSLLSFNRHIHPIFEDNCSFSGCHQSTNPASGLDLETLAPTFSSINGPVIFPFDADQSKLYLLLLGDYQGISRMPRNRSPLANEQIRAIKTWINEGATINN